jgi:hypothetical protein
MIALIEVNLNFDIEFFLMGNGAAGHEHKLIYFFSPMFVSDLFTAVYVHFGLG